MSLLMDALKKAEQEKKEAANRQKNETAGGSGEPDENDRSPIDTSTDKQNTESSNKTKPDGLTLEPAHDEEISGDTETPVRSEREELDLDEQVADNLSGKEADMDVMYESNREDTTTDDFYSGDDTGTSRTFVSAEQLIRDIGGGKDQPTPVSASTIFSAKGYVQDNQAVKWTVFVFLCLVITVSFSVVYYFSVLPSVYEFTSPAISSETGIKPGVAHTSQSTGLTKDDAGTQDSAFEQEVPLTEKGAEPQFAESGSETMADIQPKPVDSGLSVETDSDQLIVETMESAAVHPEETVAAGDQDLMVTEELRIAEPAPEVDETVVKTDEGSQMMADMTEQDHSDAVDTGIEKIHITKSKSVDVHASIINRAYQEYLVGDYHLAESDYRLVLEKYPENRDALLGLAAIKYRNGDIQSAYLNYLEVLRLYPGDVVAQSALIGLTRNVNPIKGESTIKSLLQKQPETAYLYFTLGNLYAGQENWMKAQQAFFDAFRIDSGNPDYALNLAISLDRIGQPQTALDYYRMALELVSLSPGGFDTASVSARINRITANLNSE